MVNLEEKEHIQSLIDDLEDASESSSFTDWDRDFIYSISEQWDEKKFLSPKQREVAIRLWQKL